MVSVDEAAAAVAGLCSSDIMEMRAYVRPHPRLEKVMMAVAILLSKESDSWDEIRPLLADPNGFKAMVQGLERSAISADQIERLQVFVSDPDFTVDNLNCMSIVAAKLCAWVIAVNAEYQAQH